MLALGLGLHYWTCGGGPIQFESAELQTVFPHLFYKINLLVMFGHHLSSEETIQGCERIGIFQRNRLEAQTIDASRGVTQQVAGAAPQAL